MSGLDGIPEERITGDPATDSRARCKGFDPEMFFPPTAALEHLAAPICADCPLVAPCLEDALAREERWGVWGGKTPNERARILRRQARARGAENRERREALEGEGRDAAILAARAAAADSDDGEVA